MTVVEFKEIAESTQSVLTSTAILVGAVWFFCRRVRFPRAAVSHIVTHRALREGKILLRVTIRAENSGVVLIKPESIAVRINQVRPLHPNLVGCDLVRDLQSEADWPIIAERTHHPIDHEIEPGECDEIHFDFELEAGVETVLTYSYLKNVAKKKRRPFGEPREIGWNTTTTYELHDEHPNSKTA